MRAFNSLPANSTTRLASPAVAATTLTVFLMRTEKGSSLSIGRFPDFGYDASGGGGSCSIQQGAKGSRVQADFDVRELRIPDLDSRTATFLGVPLLPLFRGWLDRETGEAAFDFLADFSFSAGSLYKAPALHVLTRLTTEEVQGKVLGGRGQRLGGDGRGRLVGVALLAKTDDWLLNAFLGLPTECRAFMNANFALA